MPTKTCKCCDEQYEVDNEEVKKANVGIEIDSARKDEVVIDQSAGIITASPEFQSVFGKAECHED